jgi:hypothetical protein
MTNRRAARACGERHAVHRLRPSVGFALRLRVKNLFVTLYINRRRRRICENSRGTADTAVPWSNRYPQATHGLLRKTGAIA